MKAVNFDLPWVWHQVGLEFGQIDVQSSIEPAEYRYEIYILVKLIPQFLVNL